MSCDAQGCCYFCQKKHTVSVCASNTETYVVLQNTDLNLRVLNTVCSFCIIKLEGIMRKAQKLKDIIEKVHIENLMRFTEPNTSIGNLENTEKSQVDENFQIQDTIDINCPLSHKSMQTEKAVEIDVEIEKSIDFLSTDIQYELRVDIDNSQFHEAGSIWKKQCRLICKFCQKEFKHVDNFNKHKRKHEGEKHYT